MFPKNLPDERRMKYLIKQCYNFFSVYYPSHSECFTIFIGFSIVYLLNLHPAWKFTCWFSLKSPCFSAITFLLIISSLFTTKELSKVKNTEPSSDTAHIGTYLNHFDICYEEVLFSHIDSSEVLDKIFIFLDISASRVLFAPLVYIILKPTSTLKAPTYLIGIA